MLGAKLCPTNESSIPPSEPRVLHEDQEQILQLDVCSHMFHAECLVSWVVIGKISCPICRAVYFGKTKEDRKVEERERDRITGNGDMLAGT